MESLFLACGKLLRLIKHYAVLKSQEHRFPITIGKKYPKEKHNDKTDNRRGLESRGRKEEGAGRRKDKKKKGSVPIIHNLGSPEGF